MDSHHNRDHQCFKTSPKGTRQKNISKLDNLYYEIDILVDHFYSRDSGAQSDYNSTNPPISIIRRCSEWRSHALLQSLYLSPDVADAAEIDLDDSRVCGLGS